MDGTLVGEYTTDSTGSFQVTGLDTGYFTVKELRAPDGYVIETSSKTIYIEAGTAGTLTFTHRDRPFVFVQCYISGTTTPIPGSRVRLYNSNGVAVRDGAVGNDGTFSFTNLEPGIYRVEYVSAPDGYSIETFEQTVEVTTTTGAVATLYASRHSSIIIHKLDGDTKDLLPGASFIIRDSKGVIQDIVTLTVLVPPSRRSWILVSIPFMSSSLPPAMCRQPPCRPSLWRTTRPPLPLSPTRESPLLWFTPTT